MSLPTGPVTPIKFEKSIARLPTLLTADTLYAVRSGAGFELYISDMTGTIAYRSNSASGGSSLEVRTVNAQNTATNSVYPVSSLSFDVNSGFSLTDLGSGEVKVSISTPISVTPIKTFNILGPFWAPVAGTSSFFVMDQTVLRSVQMTNGNVVNQDLMAGLYRNGQLLGFYTLPGGSQSISINTGDIILFANDNLTVSIVSGNGNNLSFMLLNISR